MANDGGPTTTPTGLLEDCDPRLPLDRTGQRVDFKQFVLFAKPYVPPAKGPVIWSEQEYAILQPQLLATNPGPTATPVSQLPVARPWADQFPKLPDWDLGQLFHPDPYKPIWSAYAHFALCVTLSQRWTLKGYRRGELINTISLAPGEQLTLEVHSWDKTTLKTEEELAREQDLQVGEKLTRRDAMDIAQHIPSRQFAGQKDASAAMTELAIAHDATNAAAVVQASTKALTDRVSYLSERTIEATARVRSNRKTRIEVSREQGREQKQTRQIANTNRCHSLNCHYFEITAEYDVTTTLVDPQPCLLLPCPDVTIDRSWLFCNADRVFPALLDRSLMPAFDAISLLRTYEALRALQSAEARATVSTAEVPDADLLRLRVAAIVDAFGKLPTLSLDYDTLIAAATKATSASDFVQRMGGAQKWSRGLYRWFLSDRAMGALEQLAADLAAKVAPASALATFFGTVSPADYEDRTKQKVKNFLNDLVPYHVVPFPFAEQIAEATALDDAGLHDASLAAHSSWQASLEVPEPPQPVSIPGAIAEAIAVKDVAAAEVAVARLLCHIRANELHYLQTIWATEHIDDRFLRLQKMGPIAQLVRNEILGFVGRKAAFPLLESALSLVSRWVPYAQLVAATTGTPPSSPTALTVPTQGTLLEPMVGTCDACEPYIDETRRIDLKLQNAKADAAVAEARRVAMRLDATPALLDAECCPDGEGGIVINVEGKRRGPPDRSGEDR